MKHIALYILGLILTVSVSAYGYTQREHVHGSAKGSIIIDKNIVIMELSIPAESALGFEHSPRNQDEKTILNTFILKLKEPNLMSFYKPQGLIKKDRKYAPTLVKNKVTFEINKGKQINRNHSKHHENRNDIINETHAEIRVKKTYSFSTPPNITRISTDLFSRIPDLKKLNIVTINGNKQNQFQLSHNKSKIKIKE